jgi:multiple sugar transport system ATP-binding protein
MTLLPAKLVGEGEFASLQLGDGSTLQTQVPRDGLPTGDLRLGVRPEAARVSTGEATTKAKVELVERLGERTLIYARLSDGQPITAEDEAYSRVAIGDEVSIAIEGAAAHVFGPDGTGYHRASA